MVRVTNADIVCQLIYSKIQGDFVLASAYARELPQYGIKLGLTNYAATYCTGLLCARRALTKLGLDKTDFSDEDGPRAFKAFMDTGLARTSTGAKIFAAMKGAVDGGLNVPHGEKRFPGYDKEKDALDGELLRKYIFGGHVADYMRQLEEEDKERYERQFSRYVKEGIKADNLQSIYEQAHEAIRKNPMPAKKEKKPVTTHASLKYKKARLTLEERKENVRERIEAFETQLATMEA